MQRLIPGSWLGWSLVILVTAVLISGFIRVAVVDIYTIQQQSMRPTLHDREKVAVDKRYPDAHGSRRGDVVVFNGEGSFAPYRGSSEILARTLEQSAHWLGLGSPEEVFVKRVIGVGGDTVECCDDQGRIIVNGEALDELYLPYTVTDAEPASELEFHVEVPAGRVWVMGDNRAHSVDSRALLGAPGGGMISEDRIIGRASHVLWPWDQRRSIQEVPYEQ